MVSLFRRATQHRFYAARIARVEVTAALARKERAAQLTSDALACVSTRFEREFTHRFVIIEITTALLENAAALARKHYLRGYDAVQLAAALEAHVERTAMNLAPLTLVTADNDLLAAAMADGLSTDNPNNH